MEENARSSAFQILMAMTALEAAMLDLMRTIERERGDLRHALEGGQDST